MTKQTLNDGKDALVVTINGQTRFLRVRKMGQKVLPNSSGGVQFNDASIQAQAYEVDIDGKELSSGAVVGEGVHGKNFVDGKAVASADVIKRVRSNAINDFISRNMANDLLFEIPDDLT